MRIKIAIHKSMKLDMNIILKFQYENILRSYLNLIHFHP